MVHLEFEAWKVAWKTPNWSSGMSKKHPKNPKPVRYPARLQSYNPQIPANIGNLNEFVSFRNAWYKGPVTWKHLSDSTPISITGECWTMAHDEEL